MEITLVLVIWFIGFLISYFYIRKDFGHHTWEDVFTNVIFSLCSWLMIVIIIAAIVFHIPLWNKMPPKWFPE